MQKRRRWQQTVLSNQRHDLLRRDQEGHEIDQANEPQNDKTRQPIRRRLRLACPQRRAKRVVRLTAASTVAAWRRGRYRVTFVTTGGSLLHATKLLLVLCLLNGWCFVAPSLACGEARGGSIPRRGAVTDEQKPQAKLGATQRAAGLFAPGFVAHSLQILFEICSSLAPRLDRKTLA